MSKKGDFIEFSLISKCGKMQRAMAMETLRKPPRFVDAIVQKRLLVAGGQWGGKCFAQSDREFVDGGRYLADRPLQTDRYGKWARAKQLRFGRGARDFGKSRERAGLIRGGTESI